MSDAPTQYTLTVHFEATDDKEAQREVFSWLPADFTGTITGISLKRAATSEEKA